MNANLRQQTSDFRGTTKINHEIPCEIFYTQYAIPYTKYDPLLFDKYYTKLLARSQMKSGLEELGQSPTLGEGTLG